MTVGRTLGRNVKVVAFLKSKMAAEGQVLKSAKFYSIGTIKDLYNMSIKGHRDNFICKILDDRVFLAKIGFPCLLINFARFWQSNFGYYQLQLFVAYLI